MALTAAFGPVGANGLWVVTSFALSAWAMFLLARSIVGRTDAALLAGLAFGFWPYAYATASQPLGDGWVLVILVWRMLVLLERPTARNGLLAGAAAALAMWWIQYWLLIAGVLWLSLAAAGLVVARRRGLLRAAVRAQAVMIAPVAVLLVGLAAAGLAAGFEGVPDRDPGDPSLYAARVAMYLVPGPTNPVVGDATGGYIERRFGLGSDDAIYNPIYVGLSVVLLALVGVVVLIRRRPPRSAAVAACAAAGAVALLMSAPPRFGILGVDVPMPALVVSEFTTAFRTTARFAYPVMLMLCVLLAVGAAAVLRGRRPAFAAALTIVAGVVVFTDLWGRDSSFGAPARVDLPSTVRTLRDAPDGVVAVYPLRTSVLERSSPVFLASFHRKRLFNGYRQATPSETRKLGLAQLVLPWVPGELARYGVRYVLVEKSRGGVGGLPAPGAAVPGLRRMDDDGYATLYEVDATPARDIALAESGFSKVDGDGPTAYRFMTARTGRIVVRADCDGCRRILRMTAAAIVQPRRVTVRDERGQVLLRAAVGLDPTPLAIPVEVRGRTVVSLTVDPGPQPVPGDYREAGILVNVRFMLGPGGSRPPR